MTQPREMAPENVRNMNYPKGSILFIETQENLGDGRGTISATRKIRTLHDYNPASGKPLRYEVIPDN